MKKKLNQFGRAFFLPFSSPISSAQLISFPLPSVQFDIEA